MLGYVLGRVRIQNHTYTKNKHASKNAPVIFVNPIKRRLKFGTTVHVIQIVIESIKGVKVTISLVMHRSALGPQFTLVRLHVGIWLDTSNRN